MTLKKAVVVPSNRRSNIDIFIGEWQQIESFDFWIIVEDGPKKTFTLDNRFIHVSWNEINDHLGDKSWIISKEDSAIRSYGFLKAYLLGADYVFSLDDDCYPLKNEYGYGYFTDEHIFNLTETPKWVTSTGYRTRGLPYRNLGLAKNVVLSMGLWEGIPDFDSVQTLTSSYLTESLPKTRVMPYGQYFPICGMNLCFKREILPLAYFPLMGVNSPFRRFDDIWFGIICKKICDHLGLMITCGEPYINHTKASDEFENLVKEAPGIKLNESFWEEIDAIELHQSTPISCMEEMGVKLQKLKNNIPYYKLIGEAIVQWVGLFQSKE